MRSDQSMYGALCPRVCHLTSHVGESIGSPRLAVSAFLALIVWAGAALADERGIQPPPPIDTELSRVKNVSIIRIEESDPEDDIWDDRRDFWLHEQRDHRFGRLRVKDESLLQVLCGECRISPLRVFGGDNLPDGRYNVVVKGLPKADSRTYAATNCPAPWKLRLTSRSSGKSARFPFSHSCRSTELQQI